ncbi:hypothetical protein BRC2024_KVFYQCYK_CDS_0019 [Acinetobacter phage vB_AbaP_Fishpie]
MAGAISPPIVSEAITGGSSDPQLGAIQASIDEIKTAVAAVKNGCGFEQDRDCYS